MRNQHLVGSLLLGTALVFLAFTAACKEKPRPNRGPSQGPVSGPAPTPAARKKPPAAVKDSSASLGRYASCDELQQAVHRALAYKKASDVKQDANRKKAVIETEDHASGRMQNESTSQSARPQAAKASSAPAPKQAAKKLEQFTNIQEVGVDEPDHVKIGPDNIYLLRGKQIQVADRKTLEHLGVVQLKGLSQAKKLLITARHLFVLGEKKHQICDGRLGQLREAKPRPARARRWSMKSLWRLLIPEAHAEPGFMPRRRPEPGHGTAKRPRCTTRLDTVVQAYELRSDGPPRHVRTWSFKGDYVDARMTAGRIVLIFQQQLNLAPQVRAVLDNPATSLVAVTIPKRPIQLDTNRESSLLSCGAIFRSNMHDQDYRLTKVVAIDAAILDAPPKQAGFVGGGDQIYMSTENLYIAKTGKRWLPWKPGQAEPDAARQREMRDSLQITQVGIEADSGQITILAQTDGSLRGRPKDQWAFKELTHQGSPLLGVFTTTGKMWSKDPADMTNNHLWILRRSGSELPVVAKLSDIAPGESIRSLRYIGDWAYAVTFKKTDPLFAIDLSHPLEPRIVGELKIPGFSTYMHPVGEGRLIGIGFDVHEDPTTRGASSVKFQGIKLSLFDISNPRDMRELHTMTFGGRGSYSDVTGDHHAFFYDPKLKRLAFPLTLLQGESKTEKWQNSRQITFAGAVMVQVGARKLRELARWRHNHWIPEACYQEMQKGRWWEDKTKSQDINRVYRVGDQYLTASRYGLKAYSVRTPQRTRRKLPFPGEFTDCGIGRAKN